MESANAAISFPNDDDRRSTAQKVYEDNQNSKKQLLLLCVGLEHEGVPLFDLKLAPWTALNKLNTKVDAKPSRLEYCGEVDRRAAIMDKTKMPKTANWAVPRSIWKSTH